jgi:hypothetical protein
MKHTMINAIRNTLKLGVAGGVIFGIGFAFVTQDPATTEVGPAPAKADIADFASTPLTKSAKFTEAMVGLGLKPRIYDYNGNTMFFAVGQSEKRPKELMYDIQERLVAHGVNKENRTDLKPGMANAMELDWRGLRDTPGAESMEKTLADPHFKSIAAHGEVLIDGDVVPTLVTENRIEMVGYDKNREGSSEDMEALFAGDESSRKVANLMGGYKYIDAQWVGHGTEVSAVWSSEDFSADRMQGMGNDQSPPDPDVPVCMGCSRDFRMQTKDGGDEFSSNMYNTSLGVDATFNYYRSQMEQRGWYEPGAQGMLSRLAEYMPELQAINETGRVLHLERGDDEAMQITILPDGSGSKVVATHEAADAQMAHPNKGRAK